MSLQEKSNVCFDCSKNFTFSAEERAPSGGGYANAPKRCSSCDTGTPSYGNYKNIQLGFHQKAISCYVCSVKSTKFVELKGRPVYCRDCYLK
jgi:hypothetical protein